jgi:hypothetical protein
MDENPWRRRVLSPLVKRARTELARNGKYVARRSGIVRRSLGRPGAEPEKLKEAMRLLEQGSVS